MRMTRSYKILSYIKVYVIEKYFVMYLVLNTKIQNCIFRYILSRSED